MPRTTEPKISKTIRTVVKPHILLHLIKQAYMEGILDASTNACSSTGAKMQSRLQKQAISLLNHHPAGCSPVRRFPLI